MSRARGEGAPKIEAMLAAEELGLPGPDLHIDDAEGGEISIEVD